jgi:hypothetical protein
VGASSSSSSSGAAQAAGPSDVLMMEQLEEPDPLQSFLDGKIRCLEYSGDQQVRQTMIHQGHLFTNLLIGGCQGGCSPTRSPRTTTAMQSTGQPPAVCCLRFKTVNGASNPVQLVRSSSSTQQICCCAV